MGKCLKTISYDIGIHLVCINVANSHFITVKHIFVSVYYRNVEQRIMLTGDHWVRDVHCKKCQNKLGWMYEFATEDTQRYKEARTILEKALVMEKDGIEDHIMEH